MQVFVLIIMMRNYPELCCKSYWFWMRLL